jgi:TPR repeat protein
MTPGDVEVCKTFPKPDMVGSTVAFEHACRNGYVGACVYAGRRYKQGTGVEADTVRAIELLELGCPKGWYACAELGAMYEFGEGVAKDLTRAFLTYDKACQQNQKTECHYAARVAGELGRGEDRRTRLEQGCEKNSRQSCDELTVELEKEGNTEAAKAIYDDVCQRMHYKPYCDAYVRLGGTLEPGFKPFPRSKQTAVDDF